MVVALKALLGTPNCVRYGDKALKAFVMQLVEKVLLKFIEFKEFTIVVSDACRQLGKIAFKFLEQNELDEATMFN